MEHDNINVLVLGARVVGVEPARELIRAFLNANFSGEERHLRRLAKMTALENRLRALEVFGQSAWRDYIRGFKYVFVVGTSGDRLFKDRGIRRDAGQPSSSMNRRNSPPEARTLGAKTLYEKLAVRDIQDAADALLLLPSRRRANIQ